MIRTLFAVLTIAAVWLAGCSGSCSHTSIKFQTDERLVNAIVWEDVHPDMLSFLKAVVDHDQSIACRCNIDPALSLADRRQVFGKGHYAYYTFYLHGVMKGEFPTPSLDDTVVHMPQLCLTVDTRCGHVTECYLIDLLF